MKIRAKHGRLRMEFGTEYHHVGFYINPAAALLRVYRQSGVGYWSHQFNW